MRKFNLDELPPASANVVDPRDGARLVQPWTREQQAQRAEAQLAILRHALTIGDVSRDATNGSDIRELFVAGLLEEVATMAGSVFYRLTPRGRIYVEDRDLDRADRLATSGDDRAVAITFETFAPERAQRGLRPGQRWLNLDDTWQAGDEYSGDGGLSWWTSVPIGTQVTVGYLCCTPRGCRQANNVATAGSPMWQALAPLDRERGNALTPGALHALTVCAQTRSTGVYLTDVVGPTTAADLAWLVRQEFIVGQGEDDTYCITEPGWQRLLSYW